MAVSIQAQPAQADTPAEIRRERMLGYIGEHEYVRVAELQGLFGVSEVTIRTDLATMARRGLITRVHGGAMPTRRLVSERSFEETAAHNPREKAAMVFMKILHGSMWELWQAAREKDGLQPKKQ